MKIGVNTIADMPVTGGAIPCAVSGTANHIYLTPTTTISSVTDGMEFSFVPNYTSDTSSLITVEIDGKGLWALNGPDGYSFALWYDVQKNMPLKIRYAAVQDVFVISSPGISFKNSIFGNGKVKLQANGTSTIALTQNDGQSLLMWNSTTSSYRLVACPTVVNSSLFTNVNYVEGVANQSLAANQLYAVYVFNKTPSNVNDVALDFYRMYTGVNAEAWTPTLNDLGIYTKRSAIGSNTADNSRTYVGMMWTGNSDVSTSFGGTTIRNVIQSHYNLWPFPAETDTVSVGGFTSTSTSLQSSPQAIIVTEGLEELPFFEVFANYKNSTAGAVATLGLSISGTSFNGTAFNATSKLWSQTASTANKPFGMHASWGVAVPMGVFTVKPIITVDSGTASFDIHMKVHFAT